MNKMFNIVFFGIFIFIGIVFLSVSIILKNTFFEGMDNCITTKGVITNITDDNTIVEYYVKGNEYVHNFSFYSSSFNVGDKIDVCYNPNNIENVILKKEYTILFTIFFFIGISMLIVPIIVFIIRVILKNNQKRIMQTGICERFDISSIEENMYLTVNGVHPKQIVVRTYINGEEIIFKSENIYNINVNNILEDNNITSVFVYYNPDNYKKYYVDLSEIKNLLK